MLKGKPLFELPSTPASEFGTTIVPAWMATAQRINNPVGTRRRIVGKSSGADHTTKVCALMILSHGGAPLPVAARFVRSCAGYVLAPGVPAIIGAAKIAQAVQIAG